MTDAKDFAKLADELCGLREKATRGEWLLAGEGEWGSLITSSEGRAIVDANDKNAALIVALVNAGPQIIEALREAGRMRAALSDLLAGCIEEYGDPDEGAADESVGWDGTGKQMPFTYGLMQRARAALEPSNG